MKVGFIGQGYGIPCKSANDLFEAQGPENEEITTVGQAISASLNDESFHTAHFLTAFVTRSGVQEVVNTNNVADGVEDINFYVGVDQEATTEQGLEELLGTDIVTKVFRLKRSDLTYHPKVYVFEGDEKIRVITGSANVTQPGLLKNTEAATVCDADLSTESDRDFIEDVENSLLKPVDRDAANLTDSLLENLSEEGRIGDEDNRNYSSSSTNRSGQNQDSGLDLGAPPRSHHLLSHLYLNHLIQILRHHHRENRRYLVIYLTETNSHRYQSGRSMIYQLKQTENSTLVC